MLDGKTIIAIFFIIVTACGLLFATSVVNFATNKAITQLEEIPIIKNNQQAQTTLKLGENADDLQTIKQDTKNIVASAKGGFKNTMNFGLPIMIILGASFAIWYKVK